MLFFNVVSPVLSSLSFSTIYVKIWQGLLQMEKDPYLEVANMAKLVTDFIRNKVANFLFICHIIFIVMFMICIGQGVIRCQGI